MPLTYAITSNLIESSLRKVNALRENEVWCQLSSSGQADYLEDRDFYRRIPLWQIHPQCEVPVHFSPLTFFPPQLEQVEVILAS